MRVNVMHLVWLTGKGRKERSLWLVHDDRLHIAGKLSEPYTFKSIGPARYGPYINLLGVPATRRP
jgi:hypothetical protein